nr:uncharacterized mitochondrial protein AtMg00810-like [Tanacetum cinerariifolium]
MSYTAEGRYNKHGPSQESKRDTQKRPNAESSTKTINTAGPVNTATPTYVDYPSDPLMPDLEDIGIFDDVYDDRDEGAKADYNNLETIISALWIQSSHIECTRWKKLYMVFIKILDPVKQIFRYLKGQPTLGFWYPKDLPLELIAYFDSDYAGASLDRKSTTGGCQFLGLELKEYLINDGYADLVQHADKKELAIPGQTATVDFLSSCSITYALTVSPTIYASYIEQFWNTASSKTINYVKQIHAIVNGKAVVISESLERSDLLFDDEDGITCLTNDENFEILALMGYEPLSTKLTFQKGSFSPQ